MEEGSRLLLDLVVQHERVEICATFYILKHMESNTAQCTLT
jgi:hypothetical protein